jgi:ribulose-phosphate 3-epimerase
VKSLKKISPLPLDVHLMIESPEKYAAAFLNAGADYLTIHVESTKDPGHVLQEIRRLGGKPGITLRPRTPVSDLFPYLHLVDLVLVMTVEPGFGGQAFMIDQVAKISQLVQKRTEKSFKYLIEVDGGVNEQSLPFLKEADVLVAGSYIFQQPKELALEPEVFYHQQIKKLKQ